MWHKLWPSPPLSLAGWCAGRCVDRARHRDGWVSFCVSWPHNDCLLLEDIRENDLGHAAARPHLLAPSSTVYFSGWSLGVASSDPIKSASPTSSPPLHWWFQDQRGYSSSATCVAQTLWREEGGNREPEEDDWPSACRFYHPTFLLRTSLRRWCYRRCGLHCLARIGWIINAPSLPCWLASSKLLYSIFPYCNHALSWWITPSGSIYMQAMRHSGEKPSA